MIYSNLKSGAVREALSESVTIIPLAATEQHGPHLPVSTDAAIGGEIARRTEEALPNETVLLPTLWAGCSHHHLGFPGAISFSSETYIQMLQDIVRSLSRSGAKRILLLNSHGGNEAPAAEALYRLNLASDETKEAWVVFASYWRLAEREIAGQTFMTSRRLTHACEYETSLLLALDESQVDLASAAAPEPRNFSEYYRPLAEESSRVFVAETFAERTENGAMGLPSLASREKGMLLFDLLASSVVEFVKEFAGWPDRSLRSPAGLASTRHRKPECHAPH